MHFEGSIVGSPGTGVFVGGGAGVFVDGGGTDVFVGGTGVLVHACVFVGTRMFVAVAPPGKVGTTPVGMGVQLGWPGSGVGWPPPEPGVRVGVR